jgi:hypothetical protein
MKNMMILALILTVPTSVCAEENWFKSIGLSFIDLSNTIEIREKGVEQEIVSYEPNGSSIAELNLDTKWGKLGYGIDMEDEESSVPLGEAEAYFYRHQFLNQLDIHLHHFALRGGVSPSEGGNTFYSRVKTKGYNSVLSYYFEENYLAFKNRKPVEAIPYSIFASLRFGKNSIVLPEEISNYASNLGNEILLDYQYTEIGILGGAEATIHSENSFFSTKLGLGLSNFSLSGNRNGN